MRPVQKSDIFHAIAHPARRALLLTLKQGERPASELAEPFKMSFGAVSQHLRILEESALVSVRREGRQRFYRLRPDPLRDVATWVDEFAAYFSARLDALGDYLDRTYSRQPPKPRGKSGTVRRDARASKNEGS